MELTCFYLLSDLRARLELAVVSVLAVVSDRDRELSYDDYSSDNESGGATWSAKVARAVRKQLAVSIRDLMHHGLVSVCFLFITQ